MPLVITDIRPFVPGTTGWTNSDLDDPEIEKQWEAGRFEIVEGVLTSMPPAYFAGGEVLQRVIYRVIRHVGEKAGSFATEVDVVVDEDRVARADAVFLTADGKKTPTGGSARRGQA